MNQEEKISKKAVIGGILVPMISMLICFFAGWATSYGYDILALHHVTGLIERSVILSDVSDDCYYYIYDNKDNEFIIPIDHEKTRIKTDKDVKIGDTVKLKRIEGKWYITDRK